VRVRICALCLLPALVGAAERLPDMRWFFERAERFDARADLDRLTRVRAWAAVPLLFPENEPGFENDEIWRFVARAALNRLDASAAGYPPPAPPAPVQVPPPDPLRDRLGAVLTTHRLGGLQVEQAAPSCGLLPGDRLTTCDGVPLRRPEDAARLIATAAERGRTVLELADGRRLTLRLDRSLPAAQLLDLHQRGTIPPWEAPRRWRLPLHADAWLLSGLGAVELDGRAMREAPGAKGWTAVALPGAPLLLRGAHDLRAQPLRGAWREALPRLICGVRAGSALVIESEGPPHVLTVVGPDGRRWTDGEPASRHRVVRHGPAGAMAEDAIEMTGMVAISIRPVPVKPGAMRLRLLVADPGEGDPR
jgi:hypothetical protein